MANDFNTFLDAFQKVLSIASQIEPRRQEVMQDLVLAKAKQFPSRLFHYTNFRGIYGILRSNNLWATGFRFLNDTNELVYGARILVEELANFGDRNGGDVSIFLQKVANFYHEHGDSYRQFFETYVISFSEEADILSQWRVYADNARGHCIEFDFSDSRLFTILDSNTPWATETFPVIYDENTQRNLIRNGIDRLIVFLNGTDWTVSRIVAASEAEQGGILGLLIHAFEPFVISFKHLDFSEEREWRVAASCARTLTEGDKKEAIRGSSSKSYLECIFLQGDKINLWQRKLLPITRVVHGPLAEQEAIANLERAIEEEGYRDIIRCKRSAITLT